MSTSIVKDMFQDNLFTIITEEIAEQHAVFDIRLNAQHEIYKGHFPSDPITPGVCIVQMTTDLFAHIQQCSCQMTAAKNVKFLNLIKPAEHEVIRYVLDWEPLNEKSYKVKTVVTDGETVFSKLSITIAVR